MRPVLVAATLVVAACARPPGPHEGEHGAVAYWRAVGSDVVVGEQCTDAPGFRDSLSELTIEEGSFFIYRVGDDGARATAQSCETTEASTCVDATNNIVMDVQGSLLTFDPEARTEPFTGSSCELVVDELWSFRDQGEVGRLDVEAAFGLTGLPTECNEVDQALRAEAPNGLSVQGCSITLGVDLEFSHVD